MSLRQCPECDLFFDQPAGQPRAITCADCRRVEGTPTPATLAAMAECCLSAYVRGILAEKMRAHDRDSIRELGAILDRLRQPAA